MENNYFLQDYLLGVLNVPPPASPEDPFFKKIYDDVSARFQSTHPLIEIININFWAWAKQVRRIFDQLNLVRNLYGGSPMAYGFRDPQFVPFDIIAVSNLQTFDLQCIFRNFTHTHHRLIIITPESIVSNQLWVTGYPKTQIEKISIASNDNINLIAQKLFGV